MTLIYRASRPEDVVFADELNAIARDRGATVHYLLWAPGTSSAWNRSRPNG